MAIGAALQRRARPFRELGRRSLEAVLDTLSGRYSLEEFGELRSRIARDRGQRARVRPVRLRQCCARRWQVKVHRGAEDR